MRNIKTITIIVLIGFGLIYTLNGDLVSKQVGSQLDHVFAEKEVGLQSKSSPTGISPITSIEGDLYNWMGSDISEIKSEFGPPTRKSKSSYGYTWWIYTDKNDQYIQFGEADNEVVTIYATGKDLATDPVEMGQSYGLLDGQFDFSEQVAFSIGPTSYRFQLTSEDLHTKPLTRIGKDVFVQLYFDKFTKELSSIRVLNSEILLLHRPYEIFYRGDLPQSPILTEVEWREVEKGTERQIFDITNIIRNRHGKSSLSWDEQVALVAFGHSQDMEQNNYFSHYTQDGKGLMERLQDGNVYYLAAGENIAAQYTDGPAAVEGWLNSEGHREALLKEEYTHLGVGVFRSYFTQNFLKKVDE